MLLTGCRQRAVVHQPGPRTAAVEATPTNVDSPSMQFLPRQQEVAGWQLEADPLVYTGSNLTAYLGEEGRTFVPYRPLDLTVGQYLRLGGSGFATAEIFRFSDYVKAFGAYSSQKNAAMQYLALANESFAGKHSVHLWSGPFYVRILVGGAVPTSAETQLLASNIAARMPKAPSKPAVFAFMPPQNRVVNSETYSIGPGLGQPALANGFYAQYIVNGQTVDGIVVPAASRTDAARSINQLKAFFVTNGKLLDPIPNLGEDNFTGEDRYFGRTVAFRIDRFVFCFRGFGDRQPLVDLAVIADQRVLGTIRKQLQVADDASSNPSTTSQQPDWAGAQRR